MGPELGAKGEGLGRLFWESHTFTVYKDLCAITIRAHQYGIIVYLLIRQASLAVDDFQELQGRG
jgi:hypothetical protein